MDKSVDSIKKRLAIKASKFQILFSTKEGEEVLKALEEEFDQLNIHIPGDPYTTAYNLGRRDVLQYIKLLRNYNHVEND